jgi:hypothetical protein
MTTVVARIVRVLTGHTQASMLHAVDEDGLELRLEVPAAQVRAVVPGQVLVVQWSAHTVPDLRTAPETSPPITTTADPIDHEFDTHRETHGAVPGALDLDDALSTLLGPARRKE